jgi:hypothetical protein
MAIIADSHAFGDFLDGEVCREEEGLGLFEPTIEDELARRLSGNLTEQAVKSGERQAGQFRQLSRAGRGIALHAANGIFYPGVHGRGWKRDCGRPLRELRPMELILRGLGAKGNPAISVFYVRQLGGYWYPLFWGYLDGANSMPSPGASH